MHCCSTEYVGRLCHSIECIWIDFTRTSTTNAIEKMQPIAALVPLFLALLQISDMIVRPTSSL